MKKMQWFLIVLLFSMWCPQTSVAEASTESNGASLYIEKAENHKMLVYSEQQNTNVSTKVTRAEALQVVANAIHLQLDAKVQLKAVDLPITHPQYAVFRQFVELGIVDNSMYLKPDTYMTRGQLAKIVALAFAIEVDDQNITKFVDLKANYWGKAYAESLADIGVFRGNQQQFMPFHPVLKGQLAKVILEASAFKAQVNRLEVAYDRLGKRYIMTPPSDPKWVQQTLTLINDYRTKKNIPPLKLDSKLNQLATIKAYDMIERQYFGHVSPYYGQAWDLASMYQYEFVTLGENIARYISTADEAVKAWIRSDTHRENILNERFTNTGIAVVKDDTGKYYYVQLFSRK